MRAGFQAQQFLVHLRAPGHREDRERDSARERDLLQHRHACDALSLFCWTLLNIIYCCPEAVEVVVAKKLQFWYTIRQQGKVGEEASGDVSRS
jgi:hypothetical protein